MKIRIEVRREDAIRAGRDRYGYANVEVPAADFLIAEREYLAGLSASEKDGADAVVYNPASLHGVKLTAPLVSHDPAEVLRVIREAVAWKAGEDARKAQADAEHEAKRVADIEALWAKPVAGLIYHNGSGWTLTREAASLYGDSPKVAALREQVTALAVAECERRNAEAEAEKKAEEAIKAEKKRQGRLALAAWAEAHGSELCKARLANGFDSWEGLALTEYVGWVTKDVSDLLNAKGFAVGFADDPDGTDGNPRIETLKQPSLAEIRALEAATAMVETLPYAESVSVDLVRVRYDWETGEPSQHRNELELTVNIFDIADYTKCLTIPGSELHD